MSEQLKLFVWEWAKSYSWDRVVVMAPDVESARALVEKDGGFMHKDVLKKAPKVYDNPVCLYDCY